MQAAAGKMVAWFQAEVAKQDGVKNLIVFQHTPVLRQGSGEAEV
jgi:hypothetical protein